jgi:hypothetical protein
LLARTPVSICCSTHATLATTTGTYAALAVRYANGHYGGDSNKVEIFDLHSGASVPDRGGEGVGCPSYGACVSSIDQLVLGSDAVSAVHTTQEDPGCTCTVEQIQASDSTGVHTLDSITEPYGSPTTLTNLTLTGDTLTWEHNGTPRSARLQP